MDKEMLYILQSVGVVIAAGVTYLIGKSNIFNKIFFKNKLRESQDKAYRADLLALGESLQILEHTTQESDVTGVDRAVLFRGHNCGGVPAIGKPYYGDVVFSSVSDAYSNKIQLNSDEIRDKYTNILVDSGYVAMLAEAMTSESHDLIVDVASMPKGLLRSIYEMEGVKHSIISFLATRNGGDIIYMSQSSHSDEPFTTSQIINARLSANKMRQLLRDRD